MPQQHTAPEELQRRGEEIYEGTLRAQVDTPENQGKLLVIDVQTGNGEIEAGGTDAATRLLARNPCADLYFMRIGSETAFELLGCEGAKVR